MESFGEEEANKLLHLYISHLCHYVSQHVSVTGADF